MITKLFGWLLSHNDRKGNEILHTSSNAFMVFGLPFAFVEIEIVYRELDSALFTDLVRSYVYMMCPKSYLRKLVNVEPYSRAPSSSCPLPLLFFGIWSRPPEGLYHTYNMIYEYTPATDVVLMTSCRTSKFSLVQSPKIRFVLLGSAHAPPATEFDLVFSLLSHSVCGFWLCKCWNWLFGAPLQRF